MNSRKLKIVVASATVALFCQAVPAADSENCQTVRFGMMSWTDLIATTAVAKTILHSLGYKTTDTTASQPIIFGAMRDNRLDAFLGFWSPSADPIIKPFKEKKEVQTFTDPNLADGQMTLAVPTWLAEKGLRTFDDIHKFKNELGGKIYGIDPGTDINRRVQSAIEKNQFGLVDFKLLESSEAGMLASLTRANQRKNAIVFVAWKPHPMNINFSLTYLTGSNGLMGADEGKATVWTVTRANYSEQCPNVAKFLMNLKFTSDQESQMMERILNRENPVEVAEDFVSKNPRVLKAWLDGVTKFNGDSVALK